jgi:hypothetical protein
MGRSGNIWPRRSTHTLTSSFGLIQADLQVSEAGLLVKDDDLFGKQALLQYMTAVCPESQLDVAHSFCRASSFRPDSCL